ncbi:MAG: hypothetical protein EPO36_01145 [Chloroflexota bacterium]|nr:MAG: hypothetical protein EPO36_01145 [Chloroflexota bacterium]
MTPDIGGMFDFIFGITIIGVLVSLIVPIAIIVLVVWAIRRSMPHPDPAEQALRERLARGEIDMAEYQVRLRALRGGED